MASSGIHEYSTVAGSLADMTNAGKPIIQLISFLTGEVLCIVDFLSFKLARFDDPVCVMSANALIVAIRLTWSLAQAFFIDEAKNYV